TDRRPSGGRVLRRGTRRRADIGGEGVGAARVRQNRRQGLAQPRAVVMTERTLVTGASGFIGSALTRELLADGHSVVGLVEPGADLRGIDGLDIEVVVGDLRDASAVRKAVVGCQSVFHVAALYRFWSRNPREFYDINVGGTRNVLAA